MAIVIAAALLALGLVVAALLYGRAPAQAAGTASVAPAPASGDEPHRRDEGEERDEHRQGHAVDRGGGHRTLLNTIQIRSAVTGTHANWYQ